MTDREKLIEMITEAGIKYATIEGLADHLIAHGVTVREPQKPIAKGYLLENSPCWFEIKNTLGYCALEFVEITKGTGKIYHLYSIGKEIADLQDCDTYGKTWRCWEEKPTEEERKMAKWRE